MNKSFFKMPATFLSKLRLILSNSKQYGDCIAWSLNGYGVEIVDQEKFSTTALLKFYQHTSFVSFIRQLNVYGFRKTRRALEERIYYHPKFTRHKPHLERSIKRQPRRRYKRNPPSFRPKLLSIQTVFPRHFGLVRPTTVSHPTTL